jgi:hypothetical protein
MLALAKLLRIETQALTLTRFADDDAQARLDASAMQQNTMNAT